MLCVSSKHREKNKSRCAFSKFVNFRFNCCYAKTHFYFKRKRHYSEYGMIENLFFVFAYKFLKYLIVKKKTCLFSSF